MDPAAPRRLWELLETLHDVVYFTGECRAAADALGLRGFWMGYVERLTDLAATSPWEALGGERTERLAALLEPLADAVTGSGVIPRGNPTGLVRTRAGR